MLGGAHATLYAAVCVGARGGVLAVAGVIPELCAELFELADAGRHEEALALQRRIDPFCDIAGATLRGGGAEGGRGDLPATPPGRRGRRCSPRRLQTVALIREQYAGIR